MTTPNPELLCPAGNPEKLRAALRFGADAVYLSGKRFGMRAAADNFTTDELRAAAEEVHLAGKKLYLTVNITPRWQEYEALERFFDEIRDFGIDALIVADPGVLELAKKRLPGMALHLSTQAGAVSPADCDFWHRQGVSRIVLARELTFGDIAAIRARCSRELELEVFIHGAMCVSFSGRCLLSEHLTGRDANRGACAQPCRWNYRLFEIEEEKRPGMRFPIEQTDRGSFILSSKDLCMIEHIPDLMESGVASFKIEGRVKSAYYAAVTAGAYRIAIDRYRGDPAGYRFDPALLREVESVSHREYCTGYFYGEAAENPQTVTVPGYVREKAYLAMATGYDEKTGRAFFVQRNKVCAGDPCELLTPGATGRAFTAWELRDGEDVAIDAAPHPSMPFSMAVPFPVKPGDILRSGDPAKA